MSAATAAAARDIVRPSPYHGGHAHGQPTMSTATIDLERRLEQHRPELTGYCYRMLGSAFEAEDAVQETMVRAWKGFDRLEDHAAMRAWLYRIATNVCYDLLNGKQRRARPIDLGPSAVAPAVPGPTRGGEYWVEPIPDGRVMSAHTDPAELAASKESIRLAFVAALQHLPARQRAVLILREVLRWQASEVATLLGTTVVSVNSALQRARATLEAIAPRATDRAEPLDPAQQQLLDRYLDAFERYDLDAFVALLHEDVKQGMPPYEMWLQGRDEIRAWMAGPGIGCRGSRLVRTEANGMPAFAQYRANGPGGGYEPWSIHVLEIVDGEIVGLNFFLDTERYFPQFGLPPTI